MFAFCLLTISACDRQKTVCEETDIMYIEKLEDFPALENIVEQSADGEPLLVEPDATIIVAPHNNEPFYRGCSCHTGEDILE